MKMLVAMMIRSLKILISHPHRGLEIRRIRANAEMTAPTSAFPTPKLGRTPAARDQNPEAHRDAERDEAQHVDLTRERTPRTDPCPRGPQPAHRDSLPGVLGLRTRDQARRSRWDHRLGTGRECRHASRAGLCRCSQAACPPTIMQTQRLQSQRRQPRLWRLPRTQLR